MCCPDSGPYGGFDPVGGALYIDGFAARTTSGEYIDCYSNITDAGGISIDNIHTSNTSIASNSPTAGYGTNVHGLAVGDTDLNGEWPMTIWDSDGMDCYRSYYTGTAQTPMRVLKLRIRLLNSPVPNGESTETSGATIAGQQVQIIAEAINDNNQIEAQANNSVSVTTSRTLDASETGFPSSLDLSNGSSQKTILLNRVNGTERGTTFRFTPSGGGYIDFAVYTYFQVIASKEGLPNHITACGHTISNNDHFVALPSTGLCNVNMKLLRGSNSVSTTVLDVGPWYPHQTATQGNPCIGGNDPYWNTGGVPRVLSTTCDNDAAIDLADGTFADLGLTGNGYILWRFD